MGFEQSIAELERIVASMEAGDMSLEASIVAYERGVELARTCQAQLQKAEQQVRVLEQDLLRPLNPAQADEDEG
ncbi:MAG: exodeoxyribonuclease VII small subunit [Burkholderiaceae bacterium]|nr:exodeoxyribonuclease VII small subunit [Burkholderiaceae bacterium]MCD8516391.1 exodeoxyribonuclease VII small subunit [Burkholderiaceae bacterium]MCD8538210.1 exodeoxyribonuclease VII small subunit [Burkholderiaceae bacterium]